MSYHNPRKPMVDQGTIALVAACLIAKAQSRGGGKEITDTADRTLAFAVEHLNENEREVKAEIAERAAYEEARKETKP